MVQPPPHAHGGPSSPHPPAHRRRAPGYVTCGATTKAKAGDVQPPPVLLLPPNTLAQQCPVPCLVPPQPRHPWAGGHRVPRPWLGLGTLCHPLPPWQRGQWQAGTLGKGGDGGDTLTPPWAWQSVLCVSPAVCHWGGGGASPCCHTHTVTCSVPIPPLSPPPMLSVTSGGRSQRGPLVLGGAVGCVALQSHPMQGAMGLGVTHPTRLPWGLGGHPAVLWRQLPRVTHATHQAAPCTPAPPRWAPLSPARPPAPVSPVWDSPPHAGESRGSPCPRGRAWHPQVSVPGAGDIQVPWPGRCSHDISGWGSLGGQHTTPRSCTGGGVLTWYWGILACHLGDPSPKAGRC